MNVVDNLLEVLVIKQSAAKKIN